MGEDFFDEKELNKEDLLEGYIRNSDYYIRINKPDEAIKEVGKALARFPDSHEAYCKIAVAHMMKNEIEKAEESINKAISLDEDGNSLAYYNYIYAMILWEGNEYAEEKFLKALELDPNGVVYYLDYAEYLFDLDFDKYKDKIKEIIQKSLEINPDSSKAHEILGDINRHLNSYEKAEESYLNALAINPTHSVIHEKLGIVLMEVGKDKEAEEYFQEVIRANPSLGKHVKENISLIKLQRKVFFKALNHIVKTPYALRFMIFILFFVVSYILFNISLNTHWMGFLRPVLLIYSIFMMISLIIITIYVFKKTR